MNITERLFFCCSVFANELHGLAVIAIFNFPECAIGSCPRYFTETSLEWRFMRSYIITKRSM